jgi:hypothetical protein
MKNVVVASMVVLALAAAQAASGQSNGSSRDRGSRSSRDRSGSSDRSGRDSSRYDRNANSSSSSSSSRSERSPEPSPSTQPAAASVAVAPLAPTHPEAAPSADFAAKYAVVTEKNIFVRNRPPTRVPGSGRESSRGSSRRPEEAFVLRGIALQEGRNVAFIENTSAQSTQRLVAGDSVAGGKIVAMEYDSLEYETGAGKRQRIRIGRNLLGDVSTFGGPSATTSPTTRPTTGPGSTADKGLETPPLPNAENLSLEERMKLRAQQLRK